MKSNENESTNKTTKCRSSPAASWELAGVSAWRKGCGGVGERPRLYEQVDHCDDGDDDGDEEDDMRRNNVDDAEKEEDGDVDGDEDVEGWGRDRGFRLTIVMMMMVMIVMVMMVMIVMMVMRITMTKN